MNPTRYRVVYMLLGLLLIGVVVGAVVITPEGRNAGLPEAVDAIAPGDGDIVQRQVDLEIDMKPGYAISLFVDGIRVPDAEIDFTEPTGLFLWRPGPDKTFPEWTPGFHQVLVIWDRVAGLPDQGELRWSFRVQ